MLTPFIFFLYFYVPNHCVMPVQNEYKMKVFYSLSQTQFDEPIADYKVNVIFWGTFGKFQNTVKAAYCNPG